MGSLIDLTGQRFGRLVVVRRDGAYFEQAFWECICDCGAKKKICSYYLRKGISRSCGCLRKEMIAEGLNPRRLGTAARTIFGNYKGGARKRKLLFDISFDKFMELCSGDCVYCGRTFSNVWVSRSGEEFRYNGLDRVDSNIGYIVGNLVTCCGWCNRSKMDLPRSEFLENCKRVSEHQGVLV